MVIKKGSCFEESLYSKIDQKSRCPHLTCGKRAIPVPWYAEQMGEGLSNMPQG